MPDNIYAEENHYVVAGKSLRLANFIIDTIIYYILYVLIGSILIQSGIITYKNLYLWDIITVASYFFYYFLFELINGRTPAKYLTRTRTITFSNKKPGVVAVFLRTICRFCVFDTISFLGISGWHDAFTKTKVIVLKPKRKE